MTAFEQIAQAIGQPITKDIMLHAGMSESAIRGGFEVSLQDRLANLMAEDKNA